ncbi:MAG TPA: type II toxin-antitoxin system death-on-curing family toxin [Chthonomonadaceae bacterium]|nr:type II toxin-antitoxin system death-on-curing family toxin [Chthonomonadaceae bacterium]
MSQEPIRFLSLQNVLHIHEDTLAQEGGTPGVRDAGLLASAVEMPQASFGDQYLHRDLAEMAAAYLFHICQNHAFVDGNKRTAAFSSLLFLALNGVSDDLLPDEDEWEDVTLKVATGAMKKPEIAQFLRERGIAERP